MPINFPPVFPFPLTDLCVNFPPKMHSPKKVPSENYYRFHFFFFFLGCKRGSETTLYPQTLLREVVFQWKSGLGIRSVFHLFFLRSNSNPKRTYFFPRYFPQFQKGGRSLKQFVCILNFLSKSFVCQKVTPPSAVN